MITPEAEICRRIWTGTKLGPAWLDDIKIITCGTIEEHLTHLDSEPY